MEKIKNKIKLSISENLDKFEFTDNTFIKLKETLKHNRFRDTTVCVKIYDNKLIILHDTNKNEQNRKKAILKLIEDSIEYHKTKGINFPNVIFYLYVTDTYAYQFQELPFFIMAKPANKTGLLIPDNTFYYHEVNRERSSWEEIVNECGESNYEKEDVLFFAGSNTDAGRQNIRSGLHNLEIKKSVDFPLKILLSQPKLKLCEFGKYKYLLNLPGNQPWSYRFKYLFLTKSLVINVNVIQKYEEHLDWNKGWINFFDIIFKKNVDYVNIDYYWKEYDENFNKEQFEKLIDELSNVYHYYNENDNEYNKMVKSGNKRASFITKNLINESIYELFDQYSKRYNFDKLM